MPESAAQASEPAIPVTWWSWGIALIVSLRPRQWVKNAAVFFPVVFTHNLHNVPIAVKGGYVVGLFCLISSAAYLFNDVRDRKHDRVHPVKRLRPIAAGVIGSATALGLAVLIAFGCLYLGYRLDLAIGVILTLFLVNNFLYSIWLKHLVVLDAISISVGFVLRIWSGGVVVKVPPSHWILLTTFLLALFLAFSKRLGEARALGADAANHRKTLIEYQEGFSVQCMSMLAAMTILYYSLYASSEYAVERLGTGAFVYTIPFVIYGFFRYLYLVLVVGVIEDPTETLLKDRPLLLTVALWAITSIVLIYGVPWRK